MSRDLRRERPRVEPLRGNNPRLGWGDVPFSVAPYVPSPLIVVKNMLKLAGAGPDDIVYDLGCGDGRILFTAVEEFSVKRAVGYELNPTLCGSLQVKIDERDMGDRIEVTNGNFFLADLSPATLITLYLTTSGNSKLKPKFEEELGEGARVVSHDFPINGWTTRKVDDPAHYTVGSHKIFLYETPDAYTRKSTVFRSKEEESRWYQLKNLFLRDENGP